MNSVASAGARRPGDADRAIRVAPELALLGLTAAAVVGMGRLFANGSFLGPVLLAAGLSHATAALCRRRGLGLPLTTVVSAAVLALFVIWVIEPARVTHGLPGADAWRAVGHDLQRAWRQFGDVVAPVKPARGFVLAAVIVTWADGLVADWAAFRLGATFEAAVPSFTLFLFGAILGANRHRLPYAALYLAAVLVFVLAVRVARGAESTWFERGLRQGPPSMARAGTVLAVASVLTGVVVGPRLPGADRPPVIDWRHHENQSAPRVTVSPLVDIRARLVNQTDIEVFTVQSNQRAYWRLTSLDNFDGQVWGSHGSYRSAGNTLPSDVRSRATARDVTQQYAVEALSSIWLPGAYRPAGYAGAPHAPGVSFDPDSASLLTDAPTSTGLTYRVRSELAALTRPELEAVAGGGPGNLRQHYLELPSGFPTHISDLAARIVARATTPYAKALALQNYLRTRYAYSLDVPPGHDDNAMERFLFVSRRGYCEQFAGTYAAMARSVGLPSRVAVGFTPGVLARDGKYHVSGRYAHAWPEVYVDGFGWVAFEPTPGRGAPGAEAYTGIPEQQAAPATRDVPEPTPATVPQTIPAGGSVPTTEPLGRELQAGGHHHRHPSWPGRLEAAAAAVASAALLWGAGVPLAKRRRRARRRAAATDPTRRTLVAWEEASEALAAAGTGRRSSETPSEYARRAATAERLPPGALEQLAAAASAATWSASGVSQDVATRAVEGARLVGHALAARATAWERLLRQLDPRPLLTRSARPADDRPVARRAA